MSSHNNSRHKKKQLRNQDVDQRVFSLPKLKLHHVFQEFNLRYSQKKQEDSIQPTKIKRIKFKSKGNNKENEKSYRFLSKQRSLSPEKTISQYVRDRIDNERKKFHLEMLIDNNVQKDSNNEKRRRPKMTPLSQLWCQQDQKLRRNGFGIKRQERYNTKFDFLFDMQN